MPDGDRILDVWCFDRLAGTLSDAHPTMHFAYSAAWLADELPPLSQSLPLDGSFAPSAVAAFFGGLLPEGTPREQLARRLGVSGNNDFSLLAAVGGDTAGAISLQPPGQPPEPAADDVAWLDDDDLTELIAELPSRPMHADEDGEYRLSLAGAQDKLPVVLADDGRIGLTKGQTPSTHILKTPIERLNHTVANEALCPALGLALDIDAVTATPHRVNDRDFLLIERYDRRITGGRRQRLHQEDFCQALGIPTSRKYQAEGGPSLADCFKLLREAADVPAPEIVKLLDHVALNFLVGNHDAHGKNYSLLYLPEMSGAVLAPAYDIISTFAYHKSHDLSRKMAMSIGGQYKPDYVEPRHLDRLLDEAGLGVAAARRRLRTHARAAPSAARAVRAQLAATGWDVPIFDIIIEIVSQRSARLADLAAPGRRTRGPSALPLVPTSSQDASPVPGTTTQDNDARRRIRPGQRWRDSTKFPSVPDVITVEKVNSDGTVHGTRGPEGTDDTDVSAWTVDDFDRYALVEDPHWPTYIVAAMISPDDARAVELERTAGEMEGARSHTRADDGLGGPETSWRVVAPTEGDAIAQVERIVGADVPVRAALRWRDEP